MAIIPVQLNAATPDQRRAYARDFLNLDIAPGESDDAVLTAIQRAAPGNTMIFVQEQAAAPEAAPALTDTEQAAAAENLKPEEVGRPRAGSLGRSDPRFRIHIPVLDTDDPNPAAQDVMVGINGVAWQLRRGADLDVPARVVLALDNTMQELITHTDTGDEVRRNAQRISYQIIERPSAEAMAAWHAETDSKFNP